MTIKEIEERTGMDRANIRFYEKEGLLSPGRLANGYRDYSELNVETLLRIKLLRSLQIPLEDIRALQLGNKQLCDVTQAHLQRLNEEKELLSAAENICRAMQTDRADYTSLNARKYLLQLETEPRASQTTPPTVPETDVAIFPAYPWRRFLARGLDNTLYMFPLELFYLLVLHLNPNTKEGEVAFAVCTFLSYFMMLFIEPVLLHKFGTTPGKRLFGLRITNTDTEKLTYSEGLRRTWGIIRFGYGFLIPIYNIYRLWICYKLCKADDPCPWDEYAPRRRYMIRDTKSWRGTVWAIVAAALTLFTLCAEEASAQPPYTGDLTIAEFAKNYNFFADYYNDQDWIYNLLPNGKWDWYPEPSEYTSYYGAGERPPLFQYTTDENGHITSITLQEEDVSIPYFMNNDIFATCAVSMIHAQPNNTLFSYRANRVMQQLTHLSPMKFELSEAGITVRMEATFEADTLSYRYTITKE